MKKIFSERDSRGRLYVDCSECTRGRNGDDKEKCSAGWKMKYGGLGGCFCGTLIPEVEERMKLKEA